jgi:PLP dependent protein
MTTPRSIVVANVARVRDQIAAAAIEAGRTPDEVKLVAVSKYVDAASAALLVEAGCTALGEARPQQLWEKSAAPELAGVEWHLIGRLQRNKIRRTLPLVSLIHSVDTARLLAAIDEEAKQAGLRPRLLLEANLSGDVGKQGFAADELVRLLPQLAMFHNVRIVGLMTMAALDGDGSTARANFSTLRRLRDKLAASAPTNVELSELSMGMSGDFREAIAEGATIVRIGSSLVEGLPH